MSALDDLLAKQTAAENAYYQAGSPSSGPIYNAYTAALNAVDQLQTQIENTNYNTPGVEYKPAPYLGKELGAVPQPGGLTAVPLSNVDTNPAPVNNPPDPQVSSAGTDPAVPASQIDTSPTPTNFGTSTQTFDDGSTIQTFDDGSTLATGTDGSVSSSPTPVDPATDPAAGEVGSDQAGPPVSLADPANLAAARTTVGAAQMGDQPQISNLQFAANTDWRVTLRLAPGATYLYNDPQAGLLQPLKVTNGVIFPYTPYISTAYKANYSSYDLTHSNYRGYFYQNSYVDVINMTATFTAQSTSDAAYVLAVIHFFRSVTKMFYGQDAKRGSPPPLVFLSGLGDYQFNNHPSLVQQFNYTLPPDVDYISSGSPNNLGLNLQPLQNLYSTTLNAVAPTVTRLANAFLPPGAQNALPAPLQSLLSNPTYVPTKMDMTLTLLPVQSRQQVSQQFSLKNFANGQLLKGGFW